MLEFLTRNGFSIENSPQGFVCLDEAGNVIEDAAGEAYYSDAPSLEDAARDFCILLGLVPTDE